MGQDFSFGVLRVAPLQSQGVKRSPAGRQPIAVEVQATRVVSRVVAARAVGGGGGWAAANGARGYRRGQQSVWGSAAERGNTGDWLVSAQEQHKRQQQQAEQHQSHQQSLGGC